MRLKADLALLLVSIIRGSEFVALRVAGQQGSVYLFNGARYWLAAVVVIPFAIRMRRASSPTYFISREQYQWMFVAGFILFVASVLQQLGVVYTTAGNARFITRLYVVLVPVLLFLIWREKVHWISVGAVVLAGVGAFFLSTGGRFEVRVGDAALILSLASVFAVISGWLLLDETLVPVQIFGCVLIFVAVLLSQFKEWSLRGKMDSTHLVEGR